MFSIAYFQVALSIVLPTIITILKILTFCMASMLPRYSNSVRLYGKLHQDHQIILRVDIISIIWSPALVGRSRWKRDGQTAQEGMFIYLCYEFNIAYLNTWFSIYFLLQIFLFISQAACHAVFFAAVAYRQSWILQSHLPICHLFFVIASLWFSHCWHNCRLSHAVKLSKRL